MRVADLSDLLVGGIVLYGLSHLTVALVDLTWAAVVWTCQKLNLPIPSP